MPTHRLMGIGLSDEFAEILDEKGIPFEYIKVQGAGHSFGLQAAGMDLRPVVRAFTLRLRPLCDDKDVGKNVHHENTGEPKGYK